MENVIFTIQFMIIIVGVLVYVAFERKVARPTRPVRVLCAPYQEVEVKMLSITYTPQVVRQTRTPIDVSIRDWIQNDRDVQAVRSKLRTL